MIDCTKTENYFAEKARMTRTTESEYGICKINCKKCPLYPTNNWTSENLSCVSFEKRYPEKAIAIVQKWSDEHPLKTYLSEFLKTCPNTLLNDAGLPKDVCLYNLGLTDCRNDRNCVDCWNQPIKDGAESK